MACATMRALCALAHAMARSHSSDRRANWARRFAPLADPTRRDQGRCVLRGSPLTRRAPQDERRGIGSSDRARRGPRRNCETRPDFPRMARGAPRSGALEARTTAGRRIDDLPHRLDQPGLGHLELAGALLPPLLVAVDTGGRDLPRARSLTWTTPRASSSPPWMMTAGALRRSAYLSWARMPDSPR